MIGLPDIEASRPRPVMSSDILIRGGTLIDGSGSPGQSATSRSRDGRIAAIGRALPGGAAK